MSKSLLPPAIGDYIEQTFVHEPPVLQRLREETALMPSRGMQLAADQAQFLSILVGACQAKMALEIGVFTGYSSIATAMALPADGKLIACDISEDFTSMARRYWHEAGLDARIELRIGPALGTIQAIKAEGHVFDFVFIDADKPNYPNYFECALEITRRNGLIVLDNMLWSGRVADASVADADTVSIRDLNKKIADDPRVEAMLVPLGDGFTVARKR